MNWPRLPCKRFDTSVRRVKGKVAFSLVWIGRTVAAVKIRDFYTLKLKFVRYISLLYPFKFFTLSKLKNQSQQ